MGNSRRYGNVASPSDWGLILFSHGSLLCGAGAALAEHAVRLDDTGDFAAVELGYLNFSAPTFEHAVEQMAAAKIYRVVVAPFFLVPGYFVTNSLPRILADIQLDYRDHEFVVAPCLGDDARLADLLVSHGRSPLPRAVWRESRVDDTPVCHMQQDCPLRGTPACSNNAFTQVRKPIQETGGSDICDGDALLVLVHGSPRSAANEQALGTVEAARRSGDFPIVEVGFLECASPSIEQGVEACIRAGARRVTAVPYFLHLGTHVVNDLPDAIIAAQERYPDVEFRMGEYLGASPLVSGMIRDHAMAAIAAHIGKGDN